MGDATINYLSHNVHERVNKFDASGIDVNLSREHQSDKNRSCAKELSKAGIFWYFSEIVGESSRTFDVWKQKSRLDNQCAVDLKRGVVVGSSEGPR